MFLNRERVEYYRCLQLSLWLFQRDGTSRSIRHNPLRSNLLPQFYRYSERGMAADECQFSGSRWLDTRYKLENWSKSFAMAAKLCIKHFYLYGRNTVHSTVRSTKSTTPQPHQPTARITHWIGLIWARLIYHGLAAHMCSCCRHTICRWPLLWPKTLADAVSKTFEAHILWTAHRCQNRRGEQIEWWLKWKRASSSMILSVLHKTSLCYGWMSELELYHPHTTCMTRTCTARYNTVYSIV